jgi:hypothetical protein
MKFLMKYLCDGAIIFFSFFIFALGLKESSCLDKRGGELKACLVLLEGAVSGIHNKPTFTCRLLHRRSPISQPNQKGVQRIRYSGGCASAAIVVIDLLALVVIKIGN